MLQPLRQRDFALLWAGLSVSLLGDGIYFVALPFQAYALDNHPGALALVGVTFSVGMVAALPVGGIVSDRFPRKRVLMASAAVRAALMALIGALSVAGELELWHLAVLVTFFGAAEAFHYPSFTPLVAEIVPAEHLVQANALEFFVRPLFMRLAGPALGGLTVATLDPGGGFLFNAATFCVALACLSAMRVREQPAPEGEPGDGGLREGLTYVRTRPWLWATLLSAALSLLVFYGPTEVLVPYHVKNTLHEGAGAFGAFLAAQGAGGMAGAFWISRRSFPQRPVRFLYLWWGLGMFPLCLYGFTTGLWQLMALGFLVGAPMSIGIVTWTTMMQTRVPPALRGRVSSLDWVLSIALVPVSFALTAPVAAGIGIEATFVLAGALSGGVTLALLFLVPDLRERGEIVDEPGIGDGRRLHADDLDALATGEPGDRPDHGEPVVAPGIDRPAP
jgi:DHA3 family tetracycline resistance protein-like MFS transporter